MNPVTRGSVVLAAALAAISCKGDPTADLRNGVDHLLATPSALYVNNTGSQTVIVQAVDEQGNALGTSFSLGTVGAGITVVEDQTFQGVYDGHGNLVRPSHPTSVQYIVTPSTYLATDFTVNAGGKSITIPVRTAAATITTPVTPTSAQFGDTITITAPTGLSFDTLASQVYMGFSTSAAGVNTGDTSTTANVVSRSLTTIKFVPRLTALTGNPAVSGVHLDYAPAAGTFVVPTEDRVTFPGFPTLAISKTNAAVGDTITLTAPGKLRFTPASVPSIGVAGFVNLGPSADSTTLKFLIGPGADTLVTVSNLVISGIASRKYAVSTGAAKLTSPAIPTLAVGYSTTTPNVNDLVTVTAPAGFKFLPNAKVFFGGSEQQLVTSVAADSNSLIFRALHSGASGTITIANVAFSTLTILPITAPAAGAVTVAATRTVLAGTDAFATAPLVLIPDAGKNSGVHDGGAFATGPSVCSGQLGGPCRIYKFVVTGSRSFTVTATWQGTTDIGVYFVNNTNTATVITAPAAFLGCDAKPAGAGGQPEACTVTVAAGTYYLVVDSFAPFYAPPNNVDPTSTDIVISGN